ncbi:MAG: hypothetical protein IPJ03_06130 [Ignavibacteriales bacterium]|nr:hypothetical protein [Ignavibacteriales bacterium]
MSLTENDLELLSKYSNNPDKDVPEDAKEIFFKFVDRKLDNNNDNISPTVFAWHFYNKHKYKSYNNAINRGDKLNISESSRLLVDTFKLIYTSRNRKTIKKRFTFALQLLTEIAPYENYSNYSEACENGFHRHLVYYGGTRESIDDYCRLILSPSNTLNKMLAILETVLKSIK